MLGPSIGPWKGAHNRLRMWAADGTWEKVFTALLAQADAEGDLDWVLAVDSTIVRARRRGPSKGALAGGPADHALGRSRGGLTTKIHLAADGRCRPLGFVLTPGRAGDVPAFTQVMARLRVPRPAGRPRTTAGAVLADKTSHADKRQATAALRPAEACGKRLLRCRRDRSGGLAAIFIWSAR